MDASSSYYYYYIIYYDCTVCSSMYVVCDTSRSTSSTTATVLDTIPSRYFVVFCMCDPDCSAHNIVERVGG